MVGRMPIISYGSFTILKPQGHNFCYIFYDTEDLMDIIENFFSSSIWKDANVPKLDAEKTAKKIRGIFKDFREFKIE